MTWRSPWRARLPIFAMTRHRCRRAQCASSVAFPFRRGVATRCCGPARAWPGVFSRAGMALPFVSQRTRPSAVNVGTFAGSFLVGPAASAGPPPEGDLLAPAAGPLGGLSVTDVQQILSSAEATANQTRAAIRLPLGSTARMAIAVADLDGTVIRLRRMP